MMRLVDWFELGIEGTIRKQDVRHVIGKACDVDVL